MMIQPHVETIKDLVLRGKETPRISRGTVIVEDKDLVHALISSRREQFCDGCLASTKSLKPCGTCGQMYYCSKSCEKSMWSMHRFECKQYMAVQRLPIAKIRLLIRLITLEDVELKRKVAELMSHAEDFKTDSDFVFNFAGVLQTLASFAGGQLPASERDIFVLYCQIHINSFVITDQHGADIAPGIFLKAARLDHACIPNTEYIFNRRQILCLAVRDIEDKTQARINYVDPLATTSQRRALLQKRYFFNCSCPMCMDIDRDREISNLFCCQSKPLSEPSCLDQSNPDGEGTSISPRPGPEHVRCCPACNALYDNRIIDQLSQFLTSFTDQTPTVEHAADALLLYCRLRGLEIFPHTVPVKLINETTKESGVWTTMDPKYYRLFGNSPNNVLLARLCRMAGHGLWAENTDSVMRALSVKHGDNKLRDQVNQLLIATGMDYVEWQAKWCAGPQLMVGLHAIDLAGFLLRWVTDQQFACDDYMQEIQRLTASKTSVPNLGQFLCRLVFIAEDKLSIFAPHDPSTAESLKRLRTFL